MDQLIRGVAVAALWTISGTLMLFGTFEETLVLIGWGLYAACVSALVTGWSLLVKERTRMETLADIMACKVVSRDLPHIGGNR